MKIIACFLIAFVVSVNGACRADTLTLVTLESPPVEYTRSGKVTGRNVEIAQECLKRMGFESQVLIIPWKRALVMVECGNADAIIDAAYNPERARFLHYPDEAIYVEEWYAFKKADRQISFDRDLGNVAQFTLGISRGFEYGGIIQARINSNSFKRIQEVADNEMNIQKLMADRFDLFLGVKITILNHLKAMGIQGQIDLVPMTETGQPYLLSASKTYVAFSQKTMTRAMADRFSQALRAMKADGTVDRIEGQYY